MGNPGSPFDCAPLDCARGRQGRKDRGRTEHETGGGRVFRPGEDFRAVGGNGYRTGARHPDPLAARFLLPGDGGQWRQIQAFLCLCSKRI